MSATAGFDIGYEGDTAHCSCYLFHSRSRSVYVYIQRISGVV